MHESGSLRPERVARACLAPARCYLQGRKARGAIWNLRTIVQNIAFVQNRTQLRVREGNAECLDGENQPR